MSVHANPVDPDVRAEELRSLLNVRDRLVRASGELYGLRNAAGNTAERGRLQGKLEGVRLALSYLDEEIGR